MKTKIFLLIIFLIFSSVSTLAISDMNNVVAYWGLSNKSNVFNNLSLSDGLVAPTSITSGCKIGGCYNFTKSNQTLIVNLTNLTSYKGCINMWLNPQGSMPPGYAIWTFHDSGDRDIKTGNTSSLLGNYITFEPGTVLFWSSALVSNQWHMYTWCSNTTNLSAYYDGVLNVSISYSYNWTAYLNAQSLSLILGGSKTSGVNGGMGGYVGLIDEVGLWNDFLTPSQVNFLYHDGQGINYPFDTSYPQFSNYQDNNASLSGSGFGKFNITIANTNGTAKLEINGVNTTVTNLTGNIFYATSQNLSNGTYSYIWYSWGNGTNHYLNNSLTRNYIVNTSDLIYPQFSNFQDNTGTTDGIGRFNVTITNTNGTAKLDIINGNSVYVTNLTGNIFYANYTFSNSGSCAYRWYSWGNGTFHNQNISTNRAFNYIADVNVSFVNFTDNTNTLIENGTGTFRVAATESNGSVFLEINGNNISTYNNGNYYNTSYVFSNSGTYAYRWISWGNGISHKYSYSATIYYVVKAFVPIANNFSNNLSTNFSAVSNLSNVTNLTLATNTTTVQWNEQVNVLGQDFDTNVILGNNFINIKSWNLHTSLNSVATVTIHPLTCRVNQQIFYNENTTATDKQAILNNGKVCNATSTPRCTSISCINSTLHFIVSGFTAYTIGLEANLTIYDDTDNMKKYPTNNTFFYANYTNITGEISDADCNISFADGNYSMMTYNSTTGNFVYNRSFIPTGISEWNVTCNMTDYPSLSANDSLSMTLNNIAILDIPSVVNVSEGVFNCTPGVFVDLMDNDTEVSREWLWYVNGSSSNITTQSISLTDASSLICQERSFDGYNYTNYENSSNNIVINNTIQNICCQFVLSAPPFTSSYSWKIPGDCHVPYGMTGIGKNIVPEGYCTGAINVNNGGGGTPEPSVVSKKLNTSQSNVKNETIPLLNRYFNFPIGFFSVTTDGADKTMPIYYWQIIATVILFSCGGIFLFRKKIWK